MPIEVSEIDYMDLLPKCGGRLSIQDGNLIHRCASEIEAKTMLEIGVASGCSSMVLANVARATGGHLWGIDPKVEGRWFSNMKALGLEEYETLIRKFSPWVSPDEFGHPIDLLIIDGSHKTKDCITDYQTFQFYVRKGGRILFHDYTPTTHWGKAVMRAVKMILETDPLREVGLAQSKNKGTIAFEKTWEYGSII